MSNAVQTDQEIVHEGADRALRIVVGFDGSPASRRGLDEALEILATRPGSIDAVYVRERPAVTFPSMADGELETAQDEVAVGLDKLVSETVSGRSLAVTFQQLNEGPIAHEILTAAGRVAASDPDARVVIVVGRSAQAYHHLVGSVPAALAHHSRYSVLIVP